MAKLPKIVVALDTSNMDDQTLCKNAIGVKTTADPDVINPPVTDAVLKTEANAVLDVIYKRVTDQSASLTKQQEELAATVRWSYTKVGMYVEQVANDVAIAHGSVEAGENVVLRCGYKLKKKAELHPREFEVVKSGPGWVHLRQKAVAKQAGYIWKFGTTTEINKAPEQFMPVVYTLECEVVITNLNRGVIMGFQTASILPASHTSQTSPDISGSTKKASLGTATKSKKASLGAGTDHLNWSDFLYFVCQ